MHARIVHVIGAALLGVALGCTRPNAAATPSHRTVITAHELASTRAASVYDAIRAVYTMDRPQRPQVQSWLGPPTLDAPDDRLPVAYVNDAPYGPFSSLRKIPTRGVDSVKFFDATATGNRFGSWPGNWNGVIDVYMSE